MLDCWNEDILVGEFIFINKVKIKEELLLYYVVICRKIWKNIIRKYLCWLYYIIK